MNPIQDAMILAIRLYSYMIIVWSFGSFFPQWRYQKWFQMLASVVEPYVNLFRQLNLRVGMFDLSPMVAIFVLWIFSALIMSI
ncbi:YggT family protein [bacterium]|nr:YggT family protein [bacterium]